MDDNPFTPQLRDAGNPKAEAVETATSSGKAEEIFVFNGDADGLCALQQLRLGDGAGASLVTGVKRDIQLLARVSAGPGCRVTVLDVSHDRNRDDVARILAAGAALRYFDHHFAGELPNHPRFHAYIDTAPDVCTSVLVNRYQHGRHASWAVVAAFGDALPDVGRALAQKHGVAPGAIESLAQLGRCLNYNAYGEDLDDLHFSPLVLADAMLPYADPLDFIARADVMPVLAEGCRDDLHRARSIEPAFESRDATMLVLPAEKWARRVSGVLANELMQDGSRRALAILSPRRDGGYVVSVRVPAGGPVGADDFCRLFDTGGGRKLAAGINHLPEIDVDRFAARFQATFAG
ncbi:DHH family phosphoesterase [Burkholderia oklahomensis]|uniref:Dhha1 domain protein n=1 Tax=Burkholderia oklahomensis TaxID=342113 RepID=A0AAI8FM46_9BURK|nr:DHH family phosphoesterase [Burkholderia oklahomensis]AIO66166.1 putative dhha1 domain protein [Burkholderia oklahomensis]AOI41958.1 acetyltransferase [Burkholderia oklahomensis EO147]KUY61366.1 acetyltransferase [Burkholderia oklahomensis EO147]QPS36699.1 acetyltransferase [Burkholderia oklahomensis]